jgi:hypothetical protein
MTLSDFEQSLTNEQPPVDLPLPMQALWYDGTGNWKAAHDLIDQLTDRQSAHVHAYLHRKEGDIWNADYWYNRAGKKRPQVSLEEEWQMLVKEYLG